MIVCHCEVLSDRDVRAAIHGGATDLSGVAAACGATSRCGGCTSAIEDLLAEAAMAFSDPAGLLDRQAKRRLVAA